MIFTFPVESVRLETISETKIIHDNIKTLKIIIQHFYSEQCSCICMQIFAVTMGAKLPRLAKKNAASGNPTSSKVIDPKKNFNVLSNFHKVSSNSVIYRLRPY